MTETSYATILDVPETRFPIRLGVENRRIRDLFSNATRQQWNPRIDIDWASLHPERYSDEQRTAARMYWSRRAWGEYGAISESPALQIRFLHENCPADMPLFFTIRSQEESRHAEVCYLMAEHLGGYFGAPASEVAQGAVATHGIRNMALDPETSLEGTIASLVCAAEEIAFDVFRHLVEITANPVARQVSKMILRDEVRHCAFGWGLPRPADAAAERGRQGRGARLGRADDREGRAQTATTARGWRRTARAPVPRSPSTRSRGARAWAPPPRRSRSRSSCGRSPRCAPACARTGASRSRCSRTTSSIVRSDRPPMDVSPMNTPLRRERRFPVDLDTADRDIRALYEDAKAARWIPEALPWSTFDASAYEVDALAAARRVWSRRAWIEYTGIAETPALLIRFCLELDREADPKFFLTVRNTEEAWHLECFHRLSEACGGYVDAPADAAWHAVFNRSLHRDALDAKRGLDAYVLTRCAFADGFECALTRGLALRRARSGRAGGARALPRGPRTPRALRSAVCRATGGADDRGRTRCGDRRARRLRRRRRLLGLRLRGARVVDRHDRRPSRPGACRGGRARRGRRGCGSRRLRRLVRDGAHGACVNSACACRHWCTRGSAPSDGLVAFAAGRGPVDRQRLRARRARLQRHLQEHRRDQFRAGRMGDAGRDGRRQLGRESRAAAARDRARDRRGRGRGAALGAPGRRPPAAAGRRSPSRW